MKRRLALLLMLLPVFVLPSPVAWAEEPLELRVKAAFLFNFAKFVVWPAQKFESPQSPIELCVLEPDPFGAILEEMVRGKQIDARPLQVRRTARVDELGSCHLLFVGARDSASTGNVFGRIGGIGIMTVHEAEQAVPGGVARLFVQERKMRFEINTAAVEREQLQLSSKLLSVAQVVRR